jgi:heme-degrading monooxygenase HmoA
MIVRISEAWIAEGRREEFMATLHDLVATFPDRYPGMVSHAILIDRDDPDRVIYQSTWLDEESVAGYAGDDWETEPVTFDGEAELLREPLRLRHFDHAETHEDTEDFAPLD